MSTDEQWLITYYIKGSIEPFSAIIKPDKLDKVLRNLEDAKFDVYVDGQGDPVMFDIHNWTIYTRGLFRKKDQS